MIICDWPNVPGVSDRVFCVFLLPRPRLAKVEDIPGDVLYNVEPAVSIYVTLYMCN